MDTNLLNIIVTLMAKQKPTSDTLNMVVLVIAAVAPTLAALAAFLKARSVEAGVKEVHLAVNSRLDEWLKLERTQGVETGRQEERKAAVDRKV